MRMSSATNVGADKDSEKQPRGVGVVLKGEVGRATSLQFVSRAANFAWPPPNSFHRTALG